MAHGGTEEAYGGTYVAYSVLKWRMAVLPWCTVVLTGRILVLTRRAVVQEYLAECLALVEKDPKAKVRPAYAPSSTASCTPLRAVRYGGLHRLQAASVMLKMALTCAAFGDAHEVPYYHISFLPHLSVLTYPLDTLLPRITLRTVSPCSTLLNRYPIFLSRPTRSIPYLSVSPYRLDTPSPDTTLPARYPIPLYHPTHSPTYHPTRLGRRTCSAERGYGEAGGGALPTLPRLHA
eukprot:2683122-Rhodomonas_salina.1